jgi:intracellular sulfur oxidation DsrE/DsrF family protein
MKKLLTILTVAVMTLGFAAVKAGPDSKYSAEGKQKVVYHINYDNPKRLGGALRNIQNHINAVGKDNLDLRVVMHGKGVTLLKLANKDPNFKQKVLNLKDQGIKFNVCANTLRGHKINYKSDLYDVSKEDIVPSGVAEIAYLEQHGYSYVKP